MRDFRGTFAIACALSTLIYCAHAQAQNTQLTFTPWVRVCLPEQTGCVVSLLGKIQSGKPVVAVDLFESERNSQKVLRVTFPLGMQLVHGTRIIFDENPPLSAPYVICPSGGCKSDYVATPGLMQQLNTAKNLVVQAINQDGKPISLVVPLDGFVSAHNGPANSGSKQNLIAAGDGDWLSNSKPTARPQGALAYSPWTRFCLTGKEAGAKETCFTGIDAILSTGSPAAAAVLIEPQGEEKKILRVTVPTEVSLEAGTQIKIDQLEAKTAPYVICFTNGCMADYPASPQFISQLKTGSNFTLEFTTNGHRASYAFPLRDFAQAFDGPPTDPKVFEAQQKKLQDELKRRAGRGSSPKADVAPPTQSTQAAPTRAGGCAEGQSGAGGRGLDIRGVRLGMTETQLPCEFAKLPRQATPNSVLQLYEKSYCEAIPGVTEVNGIPGGRISTCLEIFFGDQSSTAPVVEVFLRYSMLGYFDYPENAIAILQKRYGTPTTIDQGVCIALLWGGPSDLFNGQRPCVSVSPLGDITNQVFAFVNGIFQKRADLSDILVATYQGLFDGNNKRFFVASLYLVDEARLRLLYNRALQSQVDQQRQLRQQELNRIAPPKF